MACRNFTRTFNRSFKEARIWLPDGSPCSKRGNGRELPDFATSPVDLTAIRRKDVPDIMGKPEQGRAKTGAAIALSQYFLRF
jgi:hypothetical protein